MAQIEDIPSSPVPGHVNPDYLHALAARVTREVDFDGGRGDVKLVVQHEACGDTKLGAFIASSTAMIRASRPWSRMLAGPFAEAQADYPKILDFTDDDPAALEVVMNVIHLRFNLVPRTLQLDALAGLAVLTDKYWLTGLVGPWLGNWIAHLSPTMKQSGNESKSLWIAWEFGLADIFDQVSHRLSLETSVASCSPKERCVPSPESHTTPPRDDTGETGLEEEVMEEYQLIAGDGVQISDFPPGVEEIIIAKRKAMIAKSLGLVYSYFNKLRATGQKLLSGHFSSLSLGNDDGDEVVCSDNRRDCVLLQAGSLLCALESLDLWPEKAAAEVHMSPAQLQSLLMEVKISDCQNHNIGKSRKKYAKDSPFRWTCGSFGNIPQQIGDINLEGSVIIDMQAERMANQRQKWEQPEIPSSWPSIV